MMRSPVASMSSVTLRREALVEWLSRPEFTHVLTLAPNRENLSFDLLRRMLGTFCYQVDQLMCDVVEVQRRHSSERLQLIAMPEKLETNPHLHCVANFSRMHWQAKLDKPWERELPRIWGKATRGSGELKLEIKSGVKVARYITKETFRRDHDFILSTDFHPDHRVIDERLNATLRLIAPERKAA